MINFQIICKLILTLFHKDLNFETEWYFHRIMREKSNKII
jgi:hypothetical protein